MLWLELFFVMSKQKNFFAIFARVFSEQELALVNVLLVIPGIYSTNIFSVIGYPW